MRNLKKFLALVLAMMMVFSMMVTVNAASLDGYSDSSSVDSKYALAVDILSQIGIFRGTDGKFNPNDTLSRAEASTLIYRVISGDVTDAQVSIYKNYGKFSDVSDDYWAAVYINYAHNGRYVVGDGTGKFNPGDKINGYQLLAILLRAIGYGKNGEFQGSGWEIRTATAANELGITKGINEGTLGQDITRQIVAQIIYNALGVEMVRWTNALSYLKEGKSLITLTPSAGLDDWGVPSTKCTAVWNKVPGTTKTATLPEKALVTYDKEVDECQVFTDIGATGSSVTATTFTNGAVNKGTQVIEATDTTNVMKTAQGRITTVYKNPGITGVTGAYIIVYKDTFFGEITGVTHVIKDDNGHTIVPALTAIDVYGGDIIDGKKNSVGPATVYVENDTTGTKGNYVSMNILETATAYVPVNVTVLTPETVTVKNVTRGRWNNAIEVVDGSGSYVVSSGYVSFQTTGDKTYLYNHTYGTYLNIFDTRLDNTAIGQSYKVYTDAKGNVLGLITANAASVGVVTNFKLVDEGKGIWSVDFEITTYDSAAKTTSTYTVRAYNYVLGERRTDRTNTEKWAEALLNTLVTVSNDLDYSGYSILTQSSAYTPVPNDMVGGRYYFWANDDTVYFIAQYDGKGDLIGFEPMVGFKNIDVLVGNPLMMSAEQDPVTGVWYVVVYRVSDTLDLPTPNNPVPNYAYIQTEDEFRTEYADYYVYYAVIDGKEDSLLVRKTAAQPLNGTGLYTYTKDRSGYASNFTWVNAVTNPDRGGNIAYQAPVGYAYNAGVLYVGIHNGDELYKTVDDDVKIYIINNKFGEVTPAGGYENLETAVIYANAEECNIAYTCNKYGWIDTLYVIDNHTDVPPVTPTTPVTSFNLFISGTNAGLLSDLSGSDMYLNGVYLDPEDIQTAGGWLLNGLDKDDVLKIDGLNANGTYIVEFTIGTTTIQLVLTADKNGVITINGSAVLAEIAAAGISGTATVTAELTTIAAATKIVVNERVYEYEDDGSTVKTDENGNQIYTDVTRYTKYVKQATPAAQTFAFTTPVKFVSGVSDPVTGGWNTLVTFTNGNKTVNLAAWPYSAGVFEAKTITITVTADLDYEEPEEPEEPVTTYVKFTLNTASSVVGSNADFLDADKIAKGGPMKGTPTDPVLVATLNSDNINKYVIVSVDTYANAATPASTASATGKFRPTADGTGVELIANISSTINIDFVLVVTLAEKATGDQLEAGVDPDAKGPNIVTSVGNEYDFENYYDALGISFDYDEIDSGKIVVKIDQSKFNSNTLRDNLWALIPGQKTDSDTPAGPKDLVVGIPFTIASTDLTGDDTTQVTLTRLVPQSGSYVMKSDTYTPKAMSDSDYDDSQTLATGFFNMYFRIAKMANALNNGAELLLKDGDTIGQVSFIYSGVAYNYTVVLELTNSAASGD